MLFADSVLIEDLGVAAVTKTISTAFFNEIVAFMEVLFKTFRTVDRPNRVTFSLNDAIVAYKSFVKFMIPLPSSYLLQIGPPDNIDV